MRRRFLVLLVLLGTVVVAAPSAGAQTDFPADPDLEAALRKGPAGYAFSDVLAGPDIRFDRAEYDALSDIAVPDETFVRSALYGLMWTHAGSGRALVVMAMSAETPAMARGYVAGAQSEARQGGSAVDRSSVPGATVMTTSSSDTPLVIVAAAVGRRAVVVMGPDEPLGRAETEAYARSLVGAVEALPVPAGVGGDAESGLVTGTDADSESAAYRAGQLVGMLLTVGLVVGVVVWLVRRGRRPSVPTAAPGWPSPPGSPAGWPQQSPQQTPGWPHQPPQQTPGWPQQSPQPAGTVGWSVPSSSVPGGPQQPATPTGWSVPPSPPPSRPPSHLPPPPAPPSASPPPA